MKFDFKPGDKVKWKSTIGIREGVFVKELKATIKVEIELGVRVSIPKYRILTGC